MNAITNSPHGVALRGLKLVAGLWHGAGGRSVVALDVVAMGPTVVLVLVAAVWVLLAPIVVRLIGVGLEGGWANSGVPLLHGVPCLLLLGGREGWCWSCSSLIVVGARWPSDFACWWYFAWRW